MNDNFDVADCPGYCGAGYALAAVVNGAVVRLVYLRDALPDWEELPGEAGYEAASRALDDRRLLPIVREMQVLGGLFVGMCSGGVLTVL